MKYVTIPPERLLKTKPRLLRFVKHHGDKRITRRAIEWLAQLEQSELAQAGNKLVAALDDRKLVGLFAVADYGEKESFIVVHQDYRHSGLGKQLTVLVSAALPRLCVRVACDNTASLRLLERCGFTPYKQTIGPTGKPTVWFVKDKLGAQGG
jgi:ribosomal protein S18 acetylase RimI-like enzyme